MLRRIVLLLVLLTTVRSAEALIAFGDPCGWTLSYDFNSNDCVVRAVIVGVDKVSAPTPKPRDNFLWIKIRLEVHETLKGPAESTLDFYDFYSEQYPPKWAEVKSEQLFFLETGAHASSRWNHENDWASLGWVLSYPETVPLEPPYRRVITDDLRLLKTRDEILAEARLVPRMSWMSKPNSDVLILLPSEVKKRLGLERDEWLGVELSDRTFRAAREWITSPDPQMRWCGAEVLVNQQSPENAAALQRFAWSMQEVQYSYGLMSRGRILQLLRTWGVKDLPPLVQPVPVFDVHQWSAWSSLAGWLLPPVIYVAYSLRRRFSLWCLVWWTIVSGIIVLGVRSYWPRDAVTRGNFDLVIERGNIYLEHQKRASSGFPAPWVVCDPMELLRYQGYWFEPMKWNLNDEWDRAGYIEMPGEEYADSYAERFWPTKSRWTPSPYPKNMPWSARVKGPIWQIPIWLILSLLVVPRAVGWICQWVRMVRSQQRGFPVEIADRKARNIDHKS